VAFLRTSSVCEIESRISLHGDALLDDFVFLPGKLDLPQEMIVQLLRPRAFALDQKQEITLLLEIEVQKRAGLLALLQAQVVFPAEHSLAPNDRNRLESAAVADCFWY
jgi:hypothetical protein